MVGQGVLATIKFRVLAAGDPGITVSRVDGRDASNHKVLVATAAPIALASVVTRTDLEPVIPNPMRVDATMQYSLAKAGPVDLSIYSVDGRRIKSLAHGLQKVGVYRATWNGTDESGSMMKPGIFFVRLEAAGVSKTRIITMVR